MDDIFVKSDENSMLIYWDIIFPCSETQFLQTAIFPKDTFNYYFTRADKNSGWFNNMLKCRFRFNVFTIYRRKNRKPRLAANQSTPNCNLFCVNLDGMKHESSTPISKLKLITVQNKKVKIMVNYHLCKIYSGMWRHFSKIHTVKSFDQWRCLEN